jgi:uncharacterized protein YndB with AHSA1/START domain
MNAQARLEAHIKLAECDVTVTRVFDAPRDLVFRMWTDPAHLMRWWGPTGYTNPVCELDARVGGSILVRMHAPSGRVVLMNGAFREVVASERLVFSAVVAMPDGEAMFEGLVTATFEDEDGRTRLTVREQAVGLVPAAVPILAGMKNSWTESLKRLATAVSSGA